MEEFKTSDVEKYVDEKKRRYDIYKELCNLPIPDDKNLLFDRIKKIDEAYLDYQDRVILDM